MRWLLDEEEIDRSPMERMRPPIVPEKPVPVLTEGQLRALLARQERRSSTAATRPSSGCCWTPAADCRRCRAGRAVVAPLARWEAGHKAVAQ